MYIERGVSFVNNLSKSPELLRLKITLLPFGDEELYLTTLSFISLYLESQILSGTGSYAIASYNENNQQTLFLHSYFLQVKGV